ncbi:MAG TPA: NAD(P)/FAD-dependent oxidoreductase [Candidatus Phocaeicola excrementigallinarum]|nr:NAD(P)/FAD-dependent oxidoreductase [Candidatus Phocaeicola excrementigallinarum]
MSFNIARENGKKRVVIVGGGFGGLKMANELSKSGFQVVLVDKNNYHQFPPLIYQVASAGLEPSSISFPFRKIFSKTEVYFRMGEARLIYPERNILQTSIGKVEYDYLVLAAGTTSNFFGNKHIEEEAIPMKTLSEAMGLRNALLGNFERSVTCATEQERCELLNIVIVGGGATGVEIAGALAEMKRYVLPKDYPDMDNNLLQIYLLEATDRLLSGMSKESSEKSAEFLKSMGVKVCLGKKVLDYQDHKVILEDGTEIPTRTFIWVSGVRANAIGNLPENVIGRGGRIKVDAFNRVEGFSNIFSIGDQCIMLGGDPEYPNGHPQLAQVAIQQGKLLAENLLRQEKGDPMKPFHYKNLGSMATVGRNKAVAEFSKVKTQGLIAWFLWLVVHLRSILGIRNKVSVLLNWMWSYLTYDRSFRLIIYARKAKEVVDREKREAEVHWGD